MLDSSEERIQIRMDLILTSFSLVSRDICRACVRNNTTRFFSYLRLYTTYHSEFKRHIHTQQATHPPHPTNLLWPAPNFGQETFVDLLAVRFCIPSLPLAVACSSRDVLDALLAATSALKGFSVSYLVRKSYCILLNCTVQYSLVQYSTFQYGIV